MHSMMKERLLTFLNRKRKFVLLSLVIPGFLILMTRNGYGQDITATLGSDTTTILIGDQFILSLELTHPKGTSIPWIQIPDTFSNLEIVQRMPIDTISPAGAEKLSRRQNFVVTSFDSGFHVVPPFTFNYTVGSDTTLQHVETEPLLITVQTVQVDTTRAIRDIKGQVNIPFSWQDLLPYLFGIIIAGIIGFLVYYFLKKRKSKIVVEEVKIPARPAHEIALEALKALDESKLWQQGNYKGYYTALTDICRTFIENRWSVAAMEMTTDEILRLKIISDQSPEQISGLRYLLELADLVKFAKATPIAHEHEQSMKNAVSFVNANATVVSERKEEVQ